MARDGTSGWTFVLGFWAAEAFEEGTTFKLEEDTARSSASKHDRDGMNVLSPSLVARAYRHLYYAVAVEALQQRESAVICIVKQWCIHDLSCDVLRRIRNLFQPKELIHQLTHSFEFKEVGSIDHAFETKSSRITQDNSLHSKV